MTNPDWQPKRKWTLEGGVRKHTIVGDVCDTLVAGPPLELRETVEVMPVAEHEAALAAVRDDDDSAGAALSRLECDLLDIHDALADPDAPSAINACWIIERIEALKAALAAARQVDEAMVARAARKWCLIMDGATEPNMQDLRAARFALRAALNLSASESKEER